MDHDLVNLSWGAIERARLGAALTQERELIVAARSAARAAGAGAARAAWNARRFAFDVRRPGVLWVGGFVVARLVVAEDVGGAIAAPGRLFRALHAHLAVERLRAAEGRAGGTRGAAIVRQALVLRAMATLAARHAAGPHCVDFVFDAPTELEELVREGPDYRYISCEFFSHFDSPPLTSLIKHRCACSTRRRRASYVSRSSFSSARSPSCRRTNAFC